MGYNGNYSNVCQEALLDDSIFAKLSIESS